MTNKEFYLQNIASDKLFHQPFWLDAVAENNWDVALIKKNDEIIASMAYYSKDGRIIMPALTQFLGPNIKPVNHKNYYQQLSETHKVLSELLKQIPNHQYFEQRWHYQYQNWLPFYWEGFKQTTKYTYVLENISDIDSIWKGMKDNARNEINKAEKELAIDSNEDITHFYKFIATALKSKSITVPYSASFLQNLFTTCLKNKSSKLFWAKNNDNKPLAAILIVWDKNTCYYLLGASAETSHSFALRLLIWHAIQYSSSFVNSFDFEGSMIEGIEHFFRSFGAIQKPYFEITKTNSRASQIKQGLNIIKKAIF